MANQFSIGDESAILFSERIYKRLAASDPIDEAIAEARLQMKLKTPEWATPILFMSSPDGKLFLRKKSSRRRTAQIQPISAPQAGKKRIGILSFAGESVWDAEMKRTCSTILDLREFFDPASDNGRFIKDPALWQSAVFPRLREFLLAEVDPENPIVLDLAAHQSIAFAAGWVLEAKSGLEVSVHQRTFGRPPLDWPPTQGEVPSGALWLEPKERIVNPSAPDRALAVTITNPGVGEQVEHFLRAKEVDVSRLLDFSVPEPHQQSVKGGAHALAMAQALIGPARGRLPHERSGRLHFFGSGPNAFFFYLGQLGRSLGQVVLYEYAFGIPDHYGRYQASIILPPPDEVQALPAGW